MKRAIFAALAAIAVAVPAAQGQSLDLDAPNWGPRLKLTPFVGYAPIVTRTENWLFISNSASGRDIYHITLGDGLAFGGTAEVQLFERFALTGSATWISRGQTVERSEATDQQFPHQGSNFLMARAGIALRLREQVSDLQVHTMTGTIWGGPAYIRETPKPDPNVPDPVFLDPFAYMGLNAGVELVLPVMSAITFSAAVEDFYFHWDDAELSRRNDIAAGGSVRSQVQSSASHNLLLRVGFSLRVW